MKVSQILDVIKNEEGFVQGSICLKSYDNKGVVYKYLIENSLGVAIRKEVFISLDPEDTSENLLDKEAIKYIEVYPAK